MRLGAIVLKLRKEGTSFGNMIGGAAEFEQAQEYPLNINAAFVIPLIDDAAANQNENEINQKITERFGIIVAIKNDEAQTEKLGVIAYDQVHAIRGELFNAILGWELPDAESIITYRGGRLLDVRNAYLWYQFEFEYVSRVVRTTITNVERETQTQKIYEISDEVGKEVAGILSPGTYAGLSAQDIVDLIPEKDEAVDWLKVYMQIMDPSKEDPYAQDLPKSDNYPNVELPNMANMIDMSDNPLDGAFKYGYNSAFDFYNKDRS